MFFVHLGFFCCHTGKLESLKASAASGSPADAANTLDKLLSELDQKLQHSIAVLGGPDSPASAALQTALMPLGSMAASVKEALAQPDTDSISITSLLDQLTAAVDEAGSSLDEGVSAASAQALSLQAAARTLVAAEGICGSLGVVMADLKQQMAAAGSGAGLEAAEESANLLRATVDEMAAQMGQLKLIGLASMEDSVDGAVAAAALEQLLADLQTKGEQMAAQVAAGEMKGTAALDEVRGSMRFVQIRDSIASKRH